MAALRPCDSAAVLSNEHQGHTTVSTLMVESVQLAKTTFKEEVSIAFCKISLVKTELEEGEYLFLHSLTSRRGVD